MRMGRKLQFQKSDLSYTLIALLFLSLVNTWFISGLVFTNLGLAKSYSYRIERKNSPLGLSIGIILNASRNMGSPGQKRNLVISTLEDLIQSLEAEDEAFLALAYDTNLNYIHDFTSDKNLLLKRVSNILLKGKKNPSFDPLVLATNKFMDARNSTKALVYITDVDSDGGRSFSEHEALEVVKTSKVPIFVFVILGFPTSNHRTGGLVGKIAAGTNPKNLKEQGIIISEEDIERANVNKAKMDYVGYLGNFSAITGGKIFEIYSNNGLEEATKNMYLTLRSQK